MAFFDRDQFEIETTHCPLCKANRKFTIFSFSPFNVVACRECSLVYLNPRLKESVIHLRYKSNSYFFHTENTGYANYMSQEKSLRLTFRRFLATLYERGLTSGKLLEIGTGYGYFLDEAKQYFQTRAGVELSKQAGLHAERLSGASIHIGGIHSIPANWDRFDLIVLINVIEHIYDPVAFLVELKQRIRTGGRIVVGTPDIGSIWFKLFKKKWPSFKVPEHVAFYTKKTLATLMQRAGLTDIQQIPFPHAFPLFLILGKLGVKIPGNIGKIPIWIPYTIVALSAAHESR